MRIDSYVHLRDDDLLRKLDDLVERDRATTAELLAVIAEVDSRRLFAPAGCSSMFAFCVERLRLSEDAAYKRIHVARAARRFPALLDFIADGRIHLTAACLLVPHLTDGNFQELTEAATHRRKVEVEEFLARRFGQTAIPKARIRVIPPVTVTPAVAATSPLSPEVEAPAAPESAVAAPAVMAPAAPDAPPARTAPRVPAPELAPAQVGEDPEARGDVMAGVPSAALTRYLLQCPISKETHDLLRYAQALLSHAVPDGDVDQVLQRALEALIPQLEKRKAAVLPKSANQRAPSPGRSPRKRHIPADVRRAVWERDRGQCTFVGRGGHRCGDRSFLEFDHMDPVARGGTASVDRIRLRCRAHNQHEAERVFGADLMTRRRNEARQVAAKSRQKATNPTCAGAS